MKARSLASATLALTLLIPAARAAADGPVFDCLQKLMHAQSKAETLEWDGLGVDPLEDNAIERQRVPKQLADAEGAYAAAVACEKSPAVRGSARYAASAQRFKRELGKLAKRLAERSAFAKQYLAAVAVDDEAISLLAAIKKTTPDGFQPMATKATAFIDKMNDEAPTIPDYLQKKVGASHAPKHPNPFLTEDWYGHVYGAIDSSMSRLMKAKDAMDLQAAQDRLRAGAVVNVLPQFKPDDSVDPRKVAKAFKLMPKKDYVFSLAARDGSRVHSYDPGGVTHPHRSRLAMQYPNDKEPKTPAFVFSDDNVVFVRYKENGYTELPSDVPGLVWNVFPNGNVVFVTFSGGRYLSYIGFLREGVAPPTTWPTKPVHLTLLQEDVEYLSKAGVLKASFGRTMARSTAAYEKCTKKIWKAAEPRFDAIDRQNIRDRVREARRGRVYDQIHAAVVRRCARYAKEYQRTWVAAMREYQRLRTATFHQARAAMLARLKGK